MRTRIGLSLLVLAITAFAQTRPRGAAPRAERIVVGTVQSASSYYAEDGRILTDYTVLQDAAVEGVGDSFFTVTLAGGVVGEMQMTVSNEPTLEIGEHALLYLTREGSHYSIAGRTQGKLTIHSEALGSTQSAAAVCYQTSNKKWAATSMPVTFKLSGSIDSSWATAIQTASNTWNQAAQSTGAHFSFRADQGSLNEIQMVDLVAKYGSNYANTYALTTVWSYVTSGQIVKAVTEVSPSWTFTTNADPSKVDVQNLMTHEFGHWLWLADISDYNCDTVTMYGWFVIGDTSRRSLEVPDITGLVTLYGGVPPAAVNLAAPTAINPADGATQQSTGVQLIWSSVGSATSYDVFVGTSQNPSFVANISGTTYNTSLSAGTTYYWRVAARNSSTTSSSPVYSFTTAPAAPAVPSAPVLTAPSNGATAVSLGTSLTWNAGTGASSYDLYFGTSASPAFIATLNATSFTPTLAANTTYYWKVVAKNAGGSTASGIASFSTAPPAPGAPSIVSPVSGVTNVGLNAALTWNAVTGADTYDVYIGTTPSVSLAATMTATTYSPTLVAGTRYYWRVVAKNSGGSTSSATANFTTVPLPPSAPALTSPLNGDTSVALGAPLVWGASSNATSYDVYFGTSANPPLATSTTSNTFSPSLASATTYYWRVVAKNAGGTTSSSTYTFKTAAAPAPAAPRAWRRVRAFDMIEYLSCFE